VIRARRQTGEIYKMALDGTIMEVRQPEGAEGVQHGTRRLPQPEQLFVSEITDWRVQKILLKPQPMKSSGGR
jgi:hypothetical protein